MSHRQHDQFTEGECPECQHEMELVSQTRWGPYYRCPECGLCTGYIRPVPAP